MKISKKLRVMAAAIALTLFGTVACVTGTVAWFVASNVVEVTGTTVQAEAEEGIVIANETHTADAHWGQKVAVSHNGQYDNPDYVDENTTPDVDEKLQAAFIPTSTSDGSTWYHANAENVDHQSAGSNTVSAITVTPDSDGLGKYDINGTSTNAADDKNVYLVNKVYIQASATSALNHQDLFVNSISVASSSQALSKSLRVLFKVTANLGGGTAAEKIYAPLATGTSVVHDYDGTGTLTDGHGHTITGASSTVTAYKTAASGANDKILDDCTIPAYLTAGTNAIEISVYIYFEGEDFNCKSSNIVASLETLVLTFKFENKAHA